MTNIRISISSTRKLKLLRILYQILFILTGFDYGFFRFRSIPLKYVKMYSVIYGIVICLSSYYVDYLDGNQYTVWLEVIIIEYSIHALQLIFINENDSFYNFYRELFLADSKCHIEIENSNNEIKLIYLSLIISICLRFLCAIFISINSLTHINFILECLFCLMSVSSHICAVSYINIFNSVNLRLKMIVEVLETTNSNLRSCQTTYKHYVDIVEKYKKVYDPMIIIGLHFSIPLIMSIIYVNIKDWHYHNKEFNVIHFAHAIYLLSLIFTQGIIAENLHNQAKKIKVILSDKLLQDRDEREYCEIRRFIRYVSARGCQFRVLKVLPLDASLVGMVLGFCVTYLIVIIQFTKLD